MASYINRAGLGAVLLMALTLGACGEDAVVPAETPPPAAAEAAKVAKKAKATEEALVDAEEALDEDGFSYNPIGKRDPFRSFIAGQREDEIRSPTPLQRYEIDQYDLVGIVWGGAMPRAMVQDPEQTGHVIELGTYIGKNWGKVTQITSKEVVITEEYQTIEGELVTNQVIMGLPVDEVPIAE
jgi:type IV pilus assembly protein PilP